MVDTAFQTKYRQEYIASFERSTSILKPFVTTEANVNGEKAVFLVTDSNREAVTRGSNGLIPASSGDQTQYECTLEEWHDLQQKTRFDITRAQSNQRSIMMEQGIMVINRKTDDIILEELETGTLDVITTPAIMSEQLALQWLTELWENDVPNDGQITCLITPRAWSYLAQNKSFASSDYQGERPWVTGPAIKSWLGATWIMWTGLTGMGTADATCIAFHKRAIGAAYSPDSFNATAGYDDEQDYSWQRTSLFMGAKLLQNNGVMHLHHLDTSPGA
jgi:hypothetical protein